MCAHMHDGVGLGDVAQPETEGESAWRGGSVGS